MDTSSFASHKNELDDACSFLRSFTHGRHGFTQQDGEAGIERVNSHCADVTNLFGSGPDAGEAAAVIADAMTCIQEARARLTLLRKNQ